MCSTAWQDCDAAKRWEPRCLTSMATGPWYRWGCVGPSGGHHEWVERL